MAKDYTFKNLKTFLEDGKKAGKEIIDALDILSSVAIIFSPIILGPQYIPLFELLDTKDKIIDLSHKVFDFLADKCGPNYKEKSENLRAAYALLTYTAYLEALPDAIPPKIRKVLLKDIQNTKQMLKESSETPEAFFSCPTISDYYADHIVTFASIKKRLLKRYQEVSEKLLLSIKETAKHNKKISDSDLEKISETLNDLPQQAIILYESQCLSLAAQFNDFALLTEFKRFDDIDSANEQAIAILEKLLKNTGKIDVGLKVLHDYISSLSPYNYTNKFVQDIVNDLQSLYSEIIQEPIIDDKEINTDNKKISLTFPKIIDAYIPQSYKCLSYQSDDIKLEDESIWNNIDIQKDIDTFMLKYLSSPDCIDYPLIILGQPGSGKSLLTKVISAQLMSASYTVIRIPLREVNADSEIGVLVENQIKKLTGKSLSSIGDYGGFAEHFNEKPLTIILDGYDELLQAKGEVFLNYLERVRTFQQTQRGLNRPVRIIITSRITLIDKAQIPINSTIVKLLDFDQQQQKSWVDIWNKTNSKYYESNNIKAFKLPSQNTKANKSVLTLAKQPLLLLMLALYDSESNELASTKEIKRTELYNNLIRRFIRRERKRYVKGFDTLSQEAQEEIIDSEMMRLGVVAIGMYNRQEVFIHAQQLESDLEVFKAHRNDNNDKIYALKESESVLGGFFFMHKSTAQDSNAHSKVTENAYEFLHNTFGEFLAADFILKNTIKAIKKVFVEREILRNPSIQPSSIESAWYYCLMYVPLYSRPVVIEMLREHVSKLLASQTITNQPITYELFIENLYYLVQNHLKMILNTTTIPEAFENGTHFERELSLLGHLSTYTLNLIILVSALSREGYVFDEKLYVQAEDNPLYSRPWEKLTALWKSWFSQADLMGLSAILKAQKDNSKVRIICNETFESTRYEQPIDIALCVSYTLGDKLQAGLAGLQTQRFSEIIRMNDASICKLLESESPDLSVVYLINLLKEEIYAFTSGKRDAEILVFNINKINEIIQTIIEANLFFSISDYNLLSLLEVLAECISYKTVYTYVRKQLVEAILAMVEKINKPNSKLSVNAYCVNYCLSFLHRNIASDHWLRYSNTFSDIYKFRFYSDRRDLLWTVNLRPYYDYLGNSFSLLGYDVFDLSRELFPPYHKSGMIEEIDDKIITAISYTNPAVISHAMHNLLNNDEMDNKQIAIHTLEIYLKCCLEQLKNYGLGYIDCDIIIDAICLANIAHKKAFVAEIKAILVSEYFSNGNYDAAIAHNPRFISGLLKYLPDIFSLSFCENIISLISYSLREDHFVRMLSPRAHDTISLLHGISTHLNWFSITDIPKNIIPCFSTIIDVIKTDSIDPSRISVGKLNEFLWWANFTDNKELIGELKNIRDF